MKLVAAVFTISVLANVVYVPPANAQIQQLVESICGYVGDDEKGRLRKKLKESRVKLRNIYSGVSCYGNNLLRHAMKSESANVGAFIVKKLPASELAASGDLAWANENGYGDTSIAAALKERISD